MPRHAIVVPCYNEERRLHLDAFDRFAKACPNARVIFVNDGSKDGTVLKCESLRRANPESFEVISLERNQGKAEAVRQGVLHALATSCDFVGYWDADLATPLDEFALFIAIFNELPTVEIVLGSRVKLLGHRIRRHEVRHYLSRVFAAQASLALRLPVYDTQCGAKVFRINEKTRNIFAEPFISRWLFDVELLFRFIQQCPGGSSIEAAGKMYEFPVRQWNDVKGSKVKMSAFIKALPELWRIKRAYRL